MLTTYTITELKQKRNKQHHVPTKLVGLNTVGMTRMILRMDVDGVMENMVGSSSGNSSTVSSTSSKAALAKEKAWIEIDVNQHPAWSISQGDSTIDLACSRKRPRLTNCIKYTTEWDISWRWPDDP
jgi:ribosomal protein L31